MSGKRKGVGGCGEGGRRKIPEEEGAAAGQAVAATKNPGRGPGRSTTTAPEYACRS